MAAPADFSSVLATHENFEMNDRKLQPKGKLQTPGSKLQGNTKFQAPKAGLKILRFLKFGVWSFSGAWSLVFGALFALLLGACLIASASQPSISLSGLPLSFEPQERRLGEPCIFLARGQNYQFAITPTGAQIDLVATHSGRDQFAGHASRIRHHGTLNTEHITRAVRMELIGANPYALLRGDGALSGKINYLTGNDSSQWRTDLPLYSKVQVDGVYPGVNLIYYGNQHQLEYDFVVAPYANPESIALRFEGADKIEINKDGELVLSLGSNEITFHRPVLYQEVRGERRPVTGGYQFEDAHTVTFSVGHYDHSLPLVIDPVLSYSTYFGGNLGDKASGVKVDASGFIYIAGETFSRKWPEFPFVGADTNFNGGHFDGDAFVAKLSNDASSLIYLTYIGGSEDDGALDLALDSAGNPYITGFTDSTDFPTANAAFPNIRGFRDPKFHTYPTDAFVAELDQTNGSLIFSTYLGGSKADVASSITVDSGGNIYVAGYTFSSDFPTSSAFFTNAPIVGYTNGVTGSNDIFVTELAPDGAGLKYVTLFGGAGLDEADGIAVDDIGHVYVCGFTGSTNFPSLNGLANTNGVGPRTLNGVANPFKTYHGIRNPPFDAFLARFDTAKSGPDSLEFSTLFGGRNNDAAFRMVLYTNTDVIITGNTHSPDFPTNSFLANPRFEANAANADAFLVKFSFATNPPALSYSSPFGGTGDDVGWGVALDPSGNVYVVGTTSSGNFPTTNGAPLLHTNHIGAHDVFITAFSNDASAMIYSVQFGGKANDFGYAIAVDSTNNAYIVGRTLSGNFPVTNASTSFYLPGKFGKRYGTNDAFLAKIIGDVASTVLTANAPPVPPPTLTTTFSGNSIQLAWPASATNYVLESTTNLALLSNWVPVSVPVATINGIRQAQVPATNCYLFFRLRK
jgi:hypothetical protein